MVNGLCDKTMVDMNWTEIKKYADKQAVVLIPIGVIEEHGPHLCLGTDIYTAHLQCIYISRRLESYNIPSVIAPPFYWGICQATGSFIGSFTMRKETARALLIDIIDSLVRFGFKKIFGINAHGDIEQNIVIMEAFKEASEKYQAGISYVFLRHLLHHYGLTGDEAHICPLEQQKISVGNSRYPDVHAGDIETATIERYYPHLVDKDKAETLKPVSLGDDRIMSWLYGGKTEELSPGGYLGSPSEYRQVDVEKNMNDYSERISTAIIEYIDLHKI